MHPFIATINQSDSAYEDLAHQLLSDKHPLAPALYRAITARDAAVLEQDIETTLAHVGNDDLGIFLQLSWALGLAILSGESSHAWAILRRVNQMTANHAPVIQSFGWMVHGFLKGLEGDLAGREKAQRQACVILPINHPRRLVAVVNLALLLALQGRMADLGDDARPHNDVLEQWPMTAGRYTMARWIDACERGDWSLAGHLSTSPALPTSHKYHGIRNHCLGLMEVGQALDNRSLVDIPPVLWKPPVDRIDLPQAVPLLIASGHPSRALDWAKKQQRLNRPGPESWTSNLILAELCNGNATHARRLHNIKQRPDLPNLLDQSLSFLIAEALGDHEIAGTSWAKLNHLADRLNAWGRVGMLTNLSRCISPSRLLIYTKTGTAPPKIKQSANNQRYEIASPASDPILGECEEIEQVRQQLIHQAQHDMPVLILGETGTGKDLIARRLHQLACADRPYFAINCAALSDNLLETELFGHERGAFTGAEKARPGLIESAEDGILFLDEIGDTSTRFQALLLRLIENGEFRRVGSNNVRKARCRIVAATNRNLTSAMGEGGFRSDLFYRLQGSIIRLPPLRQRKRDVITIARSLLNRERFDGHECVPTTGFEELLLQHQWPGNVRELQHCITLVRTYSSDNPEPDQSILAMVLAELSPHADDLSPILPSPSQPQKVGSKARRLDKVRSLLYQRKKLTRKNVMEELIVSGSTATQYLKKLCEEGTGKMVRPSKKPASFYVALTDNTE